MLDDSGSAPEPTNERRRTGGGEAQASDALAADGVAYVPFFPLGGFSPLQSSALSAVSERRGTTPMAVALAWLLQRSPNVLLVPGTSSVDHLRENVAGAALVLDDDDLAELDRIGRADGAPA